jgi:hypothetical protein
MCERCLLQPAAAAGFGVPAVGEIGVPDPGPAHPAHIPVLRRHRFGRAGSGGDRRAVSRPQEAVSS